MVQDLEEGSSCCPFCFKQLPFSGKPHPLFGVGSGVVVVVVVFIQRTHCIESTIDLYKDPLCSSLSLLSNLYVQVERSALRTKVKYLKDLVISGGFIESKFDTLPTSPKMKKWPVGTATSTGGKVEDEVSCVQDGLADLKRAITEVVECWNIL